MQMLTITNVTIAVVVAYRMQPHGPVLHSWVPSVGHTIGQLHLESCSGFSSVQAWSSRFALGWASNPNCPKKFRIGSPLQK